MGGKARVWRARSSDFAKRAQGASFVMMMVPEAANMPPTPWQTEIRAPGIWAGAAPRIWRSEEHTSELQSHLNLVCRLLLEKKKESMQRVRSSEPTVGLRPHLAWTSVQR